MEGERMTQARFEDIANNDININQERRIAIRIDKMDFVNKCQEYWGRQKHPFCDSFYSLDNLWRET